jgi:hypothetical protein
MCSSDDKKCVHVLNKWNKNKYVIILHCEILDIHNTLNETENDNNWRSTDFDSYRNVVAK